MGSLLITSVTGIIYMWMFAFVIYIYYFCN